ncbi:hypothetical protein GCM10019016_136720 [Streptomyces prasinosporus]|uniref:Iron ABC transporter permease n=1 Tax=Streptomyces prasinosporus TaxID=68256 RepID=A0ABP6UFL8_9ACTN
MKTNRAVRVPGGLSVRLDVRALTVVVLLMLAALGASVVLIGTGDFPMSSADVLRTLVGQGDRGAGVHRHRAAAARGSWSGLLVGASLGLGGALFQSVSRNPAGQSPTSSASARARRPAPSR